jgi:hypothetical protein
MTCKLSKSSKPNVDFEGETGSQMQLGVSSDSGGATIVSVVYDGTTLSAPPWSITLASGKKLLTVVVDNPVPGDWTTIEEICNGDTQPLKRYPFDPVGPSQSFTIEGI